MSVITPKGYQDDAVNNALEIFRYAESQLQHANDDESRRTISAFNGCVLLEAPTGAGKTLMAGLIAERFSRADHRDNAKVVWFWFTPFANLVEQAKIALKKDFSGLTIRDLSHERVAYKALSGDVFVTTWASVAASNATTRKLRSSGDTSLSLDEFIVELRAAGFRIGVVIDEAHHNFTKANEAVKFYRDIMSPEFSLLITATPNDTDVEIFKKAAGLAEIHHIQISRKNAVDVGLIKEAVKSIAYLVPEQQHSLVDLEHTALEDGWRTHCAIKQTLANVNIRLTPLMLVQVDSKGKAGEEAINKVKQRLIDMGVNEDAIAWYTADDPNDDLLVVAKDESKEVLIFKVAVALGFDAPRAFTLVSLRGSKNTDFGIQVIGRILRVHSRLQAMAAAKTLPDLLRFGYVFLADSEAQSGLCGAANKINSIQTQMSAITPYTMLVKIAGQTEVQVSHNGQLSLLPQPYTPPEWQETQNIIKTDYQPLGETADIWQDLIIPQTNKITEKSPLDYLVQLNNGCIYKLRDNIPTYFKSERIPLNTDDLIQSVMFNIPITAEILNAGLRKSTKVTRKTVNNIFEQPQEIVDSVQAKLSNLEIAKRAQKVLFDASFVDMRDLHAKLLEKLTKEYNEYNGYDLSEQELKRALNMILATYPKLIPQAIKKSLAKHKETYNTAELPKQITASESVNLAHLNSYGIMPEDLNNTERKFAQLLETDTSGTILWWHRNEARKPHSVGIVLTDGNRYFPDFIIGINHYNNERIILIEIKGGHILNNEETQEKITAEHAIYGKPLMLSLLDDGQFWIMKYIESNHKIEKDSVFRVENIGHYLTEY